MFGQFLLKRNILNEEQLDNLLLVQKYNKEKIGRIALDLGILSSDELDRELSIFLETSDERSLKEIIDACKNISEFKLANDFLVKERILPRRLENDLVEVVTDNFSDEKIIKLERMFNSEISLKLVDSKKLNLIFDVLFPESDIQGSEIVVSESYSDDDKLKMLDPYSKLIKSCFEQAKRLKASDIHFEAFQNEYLIRFRVFGKLKDWKKFSVDHSMPINSKLKYIVNMDLAIIGRPQDSRASFEDLGIDVRANSMPVTSGHEKVVLRLQYHDQKYTLSALGLSEKNTKVLVESISKSDGLILISGPTGSGKTTTLYALLEEMDRMGKNISTLENPVEKRLERINQANISDYRDFEDFQKALMRQDPDVILLGEVRDSETASLAIKLAATGHLVLSTIHANGAIEVIDRLANLGVDEYSIKTNLRLSVAQRLVRIICSECSIESNESLLESYQLKGEHFKEINSLGCSSCNSGVTGRMAIIEYLSKDNLVDGKWPSKLENTLGDECLRLAKQGRIDVNDFIFYR